MILNLTKVKPFCSISDGVDIIDRFPFIDYIQLYCPNIPSAFLNCFEFADDHFILICPITGRTLKSQVVHGFNKTSMTVTFSNNVRFYFYGFEWDDLSYGNKCKLKIYISGSSIPFFSYPGKMITYIKDIVRNFTTRLDHKVANTNKSQKSFINLVDCSISRIDLAVNYLDDYDDETMSYFNYEKMKFWSQQKSSLRKYYDAQVFGMPFATGVSLGRGNKKSLQLKVYNKKFDPSNGHDLIKFKSVDFHRVEYKVFKPTLNKIKWIDDDGSNLHKLGTLDVLTVYHIRILWRYLVQVKAPMISLDRDEPYPRNEIMPHKRKNASDTLRYKAVKGYLYPYWGKPGFNKLLKHLNNWFLENTSVIESDTTWKEIKNDIEYNQ